MVLTDDDHWSGFHPDNNKRAITWALKQRETAAAEVAPAITAKEPALTTSGPEPPTPDRQTTPASTAPLTPDDRMNTSRPHRQRTMTGDNDRSTGVILSREPVAESDDRESSTAATAANLLDALTSLLYMARETHTVPERAEQAALTQELIDLAQTAREELRMLRADTSNDYDPEVLRLALLTALHTPKQAHAIAVEFGISRSNTRPPVTSGL